MRNSRVFGWLSLLILTAAASAQLTAIDPQVRSKPTADHKITTIELTAHFVTTIRAPEPVNSVVVGDPALFQVEHSEHEPELVFVKTLTTENAESNLLISTAKGRQISFLLVSHGRGASPAKVFRFNQKTPGGLVAQQDRSFRTGCADRQRVEASVSYRWSDRNHCTIERDIGASRVQPDGNAGSFESAQIGFP
jgi:type IV secretory pathway VirB9-like protein